MSLEAILAKIESDAAKEAEDILGEASREKEEALRRTSARLEDQQARDMQKLDREMVDLRERMADHSRREAGKKLQNRRRQLIDSAIRNAVSDLAGTGDGEYLELVRQIISGCGATGRIEVVISPADVKRITQAFLDSCSGDGREFVLSPERHDQPGGVVLVSDRISYNGTFSMIAELVHEQLVMKLSSLIPLE